MKKESLSAIFLVGLPGSGKTTLGELLAKKMGLNFIDLDDYIEEKSKMTIPQIFEEFGEDEFRKLENNALQECFNMTSTVIATGGGIVVNPTNRDLLKQSNSVVHVDRPCKDIIENVYMANRPLLRNNPEKIYELHEQRKKYYSEVCDISILNNEDLHSLMLNLYKFFK